MDRRAKAERKTWKGLVDRSEVVKRCQRERCLNAVEYGSVKSSGRGLRGEDEGGRREECGLQNLHAVGEDRAKMAKRSDKRYKRTLSLLGCLDMGSRLWT